MKEWSVSFCEGAYKTEKFENLYREDYVASIAFGKHEKDMCSWRCSTCETAATDKCITCGEHRVNAPSCVCKEGYFEHEDKYYGCIPCRKECLTCKDADSCITCAGNRVNPEKGCPCPSKHYDNGEIECPACSDACKECDLDGNCTKCRANAGPVPDCPCNGHHFPNMH